MVTYTRPSSVLHHVTSGEIGTRRLRGRRSGTGDQRQHHQHGTRKQPPHRISYRALTTMASLTGRGPVTSDGLLITAPPATIVVDPPPSRLSAFTRSSLAQSAKELLERHPDAVVRLAAVDGHEPQHPLPIDADERARMAHLRERQRAAGSPSPASPTSSTPSRTRSPAPLTTSRACSKCSSGVPLRIFHRVSNVTVGARQQPFERRRQLQTTERQHGAGTRNGRFAEVPADVDDLERLAVQNPLGAVCGAVSVSA